MTKWEYTNIVCYKNDFLNFLTEGLHDYGEHGWEMCGVTSYIDVVPEGTANVYVIIFKRKIED